MWIFLLISPTPGSRIAEWLLGVFGEWFASAPLPLALPMTMLSGAWRPTSGTCSSLVIPGWMRRTMDGKAVHSAEL